MKILKSIIPQRIKTKEQLAKFVETAHTPAKIFGMEFRPRFVLQRDVDVFMRIVTIPENTIVRYRGKGNYSTALEVSDNATFRAKKATFADTESQGRFLKLDYVYGDLTTHKGGAKVRCVKDTATHRGEGTQKIGYAKEAILHGAGTQKVEKTERAKTIGEGTQINGYAETATHYGEGTQTNIYAKKTYQYGLGTQINKKAEKAVSYSKGTQTNDMVEIAEHNGAGEQTNRMVERAIHKGSGKQTNGFVKLEAHLLGAGKQINEQGTGIAYHYLHKEGKQINKTTKGKPYRDSANMAIYQLAPKKQR